MKTIQLLKRIALLSLTGAILASCNKDVKNSFTLYSSGGSYILQTNYGTGESLEKNFAPYIGLGAAYGTFSDVTITHNGLPVYGQTLGSYFYETDVDYTESTLAAVNGTYSIIANGINEDGTEQSASGAISFDFDEEDALGELKIKEFSYNGSRITASWDKVENATAAGIIICARQTLPGYPTAGYYRIGYNLSYVNSDYASTNECSIPIDLSAYATGQEFMVKVAVLNSAYGKGAIMLEGPAKTISNGTDHFIEDAE